MANDYSLDMFQVEEDELEKKRTFALAQLLRSQAHPPGMMDSSSRFLQGYGDTQARQSLEEIGPAKQALAGRSREAMMNSLRGMPEDIQRLAGSRETQPMALKLAEKYQQQKMDEARRGRLMEGRGSAPAEGGVDKIFLIARAILGDPGATKDDRDWAKDALEMYKPVDPANFGRIGAGGAMETISGGPQNFLQKQRVIGSQNLEDVPVPGGTQKMTREEAMRRGLIQGSPPVGGAVGGGYAPPATSAPGGYSSPASGPNNPASGGSALPASVAAESGGFEGDPLTRIIPQLEGWDPRNPISPKGAVGPYQIMPQNVAALSRLAGRQLDPMNPEDGKLMASHVLKDARNKYGNNDQAVLAYYNGGHSAGDAVASGKPPPSPETQGYLARAAQLLNPVSTAQAQPPQALPGAVAASGQGAPPQFNFSGKMSAEEAAALPNTTAALGGAQYPSTPGVTTSPTLTKGFEEQIKSNVAAMQKMEETQADFGAVISKLGTIRKMNQNPSYEGMAATGGPLLEEGVAALGGGTSSKYANTKAMEAGIQDLVGPILKQYGYNPSNRDLMQAQLRLPSMGSSAAARDQVADLVMKGMAAEQEVAQMTRQIFDQSQGRVSPHQAQQFAWKIYNKNRDDEEARQKSGNPTNAASGQQGPLAASVRAEYDKTKKQLAGENSFGSAMWEKTKSLTGAIFSGAGVEGAVDAYGNMIEGGKQMIGMGDREKGMAELRRQEERARVDPDYEQAKIFHSVANPITVAAASAPMATLPRALLAGGVMGGLHPADSAGSQAWNVAVGAGLGGVGSLASRLMPSTRAASALEGAGLTPAKAAGPVQGSSAQLNPQLAGSKLASAVAGDASSLRQAKEATQYLMGTGKIAGDRLTREGVDQAYTAAKEAQRETLAAQPIKLPKPELKGLTDSIVELIDANGPKVFGQKSALMEFLTKVTAQSQAKGGGRALRNVKTYDGEKLFQMWEEVGQFDKFKPAQAAVLKSLEDLIEGGAGKEVLEAFKGHQQTYRNISNIDRVWSSGGGSGTGVGTGWINPSHLKLEAGRGPKDAVTDSMVEIVDLLNLRNPKTLAPGSIDTVPGVVHSAAKNVFGPAVEGYDAFMQKWGGPKANVAVRHTVDALRAGAKTLPYAYQGRE